MYNNNRQGNRWSRNEVKRSLDLRQKLTHSRSSQVWCDPKKALVNSWHFQDKPGCLVCSDFLWESDVSGATRTSQSLSWIFGRMGNANPTVNCNKKRAGLIRLLADDVQGSFQEVENVISADSKKTALWRTLEDFVSQKFFGKIWQKTQMEASHVRSPCGKSPETREAWQFCRNSNREAHRYKDAPIWPPTCRAARLRPALPPALPNEPETFSWKKGCDSKGKKKTWFKAFFKTFCRYFQRSFNSQDQSIIFELLYCN